MGNNIWQESDEYYPEPVTNVAVIKAEEKLKVKLPES